MWQRHGWKCGSSPPILDKDLFEGRSQGAFQCTDLRFSFVFLRLIRVLEITSTYMLV
jgi:hypothetical protein